MENMVVVSNKKINMPDVRGSLIYIVSEFTNDELRLLIKEINSNSKNYNKNLSYNADKLFKLYSNDNWMIGIDRFSNIRKCLEIEILKRIEQDNF